MMFNQDTPPTWASSRSGPSPRRMVAAAAVASVQQQQQQQQSVEARNRAPSAAASALGGVVANNMPEWLTALHQRQQAFLAGLPYPISLIPPTLHQPQLQDSVSSSGQAVVGMFPSSNGSNDGDNDGEGAGAPGPSFNHQRRLPQSQVSGSPRRYSTYRQHDHERGLSHLHHHHQRRQQASTMPHPAGLRRSSDPPHAPQYRGVDVPPYVATSVGAAPPSQPQPPPMEPPRHVVLHHSSTPPPSTRSSSGSSSAAVPRSQSSRRRSDRIRMVYGTETNPDSGIEVVFGNPDLLDDILLLALVTNPEGEVAEMVRGGGGLRGVRLLRAAGEYRRQEIPQQRVGGDGGGHVGDEQPLHPQQVAALLQLLRISDIVHEVIARNPEPAYAQPPLSESSYDLLDRQVLTKELASLLCSDTESDSGVCTICQDTFTDLVPGGVTPGLPCSPAAALTAAKLTRGVLVEQRWHSSTAGTQQHRAIDRDELGEHDDVQVDVTAEDEDEEEVGHPCPHGAVTDQRAKTAVHEVCRLPCNHIFCWECLRGWLERTRTCPNCRFSLEHVTEQYRESNTAPPVWWPPMRQRALRTPTQTAVLPVGATRIGQHRGHGSDLVSSDSDLSSSDTESNMDDDDATVFHVASTFQRVLTAEDEEEDDDEASSSGEDENANDGNGRADGATTVLSGGGVYYHSSARVSGGALHIVQDTTGNVAINFAEDPIENAQGESAAHHVRSVVYEVGSRADDVEEEEHHADEEEEDGGESRYESVATVAFVGYAQGRDGASSCPEGSFNRYFTDHFGTSENWQQPSSPHVPAASLHHVSDGDSSEDDMDSLSSYSGDSMTEQDSLLGGMEGDHHLVHTSTESANPFSTWTGWVDQRVAGEQRQRTEQRRLNQQPQQQRVADAGRTPHPSGSDLRYTATPLGSDSDQRWEHATAAVAAPAPCEPPARLNLRLQAPYHQPSTSYWRNNTSSTALVHGNVYDPAGGAGFLVDGHHASTGTPGTGGGRARSPQAVVQSGGMAGSPHRPLPSPASSRYDSTYYAALPYGESGSGWVPTRPSLPFSQEKQSIALQAGQHPQQQQQRLSGSPNIITDVLSSGSGDNVRNSGTSGLSGSAYPSLGATGMEEPLSSPFQELAMMNAALSSATDMTVMSSSPPLEMLSPHPQRNVPHAEQLRSHRNVSPY